MNKTYLNPPPLTHLVLRFYGALNDFLLPQRKRKRFPCCVKGRPSIKDTIEALRVPHPEVGCIVVGDRAVDFFYQPVSGDCIQIYPVDHFSLRREDQLLRRRLPRERKFILDSHLGKLVRHLRLLGFDCSYKKIFPDQEIVETAVRQRRIILTRDLGLLKNRKVEYGYWVRSPFPERQLGEIVKTFRIAKGARPFTRCLECNGRIRTVAKAKVSAQLPAQVRRFYRRFYICRACHKIYWKGSHHARLVRVIRRAKALKQRR